MKRSVKRNEKINQTTVMQTPVERLDRRNLFGLYEMWKNTISLRSVSEVKHTIKIYLIKKENIKT